MFSAVRSFKCMSTRIIASYQKFSQMCNIPLARQLLKSACVYTTVHRGSLTLLNQSSARVFARNLIDILLCSKLKECVCKQMILPCNTWPATVCQSWTLIPTCTSDAFIKVNDTTLHGLYVYIYIYIYIYIFIYT